MATAPALQLPDVESMGAEDVLRWAHEQFGDRMCLTCSWQRQSSVLIHMVSELALDVPIVELDTLVLFPETYETRDRLVERYGLRLQSFRPIDAPDRLWETEPDRCCHIRKVEPLERALAPYDAWITGIRREQAPGRAEAPKEEWQDTRGIWKFNPLADWTDKDVWRYIAEHDLPYNQLHDRGYPTIGCTHCTVPGAGREGRWAGTGKSECGLHA